MGSNNQTTPSVTLRTLMHLITMHGEQTLVCVQSVGNFALCREIWNDGKGLKLVKIKVINGLVFLGPVVTTYIYIYIYGQILQARCGYVQ